VEGHGVQAALVLVVELDLRRHALLLDEHGEPDGRGVRARRFPWENFDAGHGAKV
jgi:hypothetical protein